MTVKDLNEPRQFSYPPIKTPKYQNYQQEIFAAMSIASQRNQVMVVGQQRSSSVAQSIE